MQIAGELEVTAESNQTIKVGYSVPVIVGGAPNNDLLLEVLDESLRTLGAVLADQLMTNLRAAMGYEDIESKARV